MKIDELRRLFDYDAWANLESLRALQSALSPPPKSVRWMAHIAGTQNLWLGRLRGDARAAIVWPDLTLAESRGEIERLRNDWRSYLLSLTEGGLSRPVSYVNSKGESWSNTVGDMLLHTVMHGGYHRGQIASDMRDAGLEPPYTDFIEAARRGHIG